MDEAVKTIAEIDGCALLRDVPISRYTSLRLRGRIGLMIECSREAALAELVRVLDRYAMRYAPIGSGSNVVISDGTDTVFIVLTGEFGEVRVNGTMVTAGAGASLGEVVSMSAELGLSGFEFLAGIPGTVGGAIRMNAGAGIKGPWIGDIIDSVRYVSKKGEAREIRAVNIKMSYREIAMPSDTVITRAGFNAETGSAEEIRARVFSVLSNKKERQDVNGYTCGSIFRNPEKSERKAWELIDMCGMRGASVGDACISSKHANFLINRGEAGGEDVRALIDMVKAKVKEETGIELVPEIHIY